MKKLYLLMIIMCSGIALMSQTIVSTSIEKRNVLLEEYTGIHCGFCPMGHNEAEMMVEQNPEDVFVIGIHQGAFAVPDPDDPNYMTEDGDELGSFFDVQSWPNGIINRHDFGEGYGYPLDMWAAYGDEILLEDSYVNVACETEIDVQSRELTVYVEAYYTGNSPENTNKLSVALLQNDVKGPQWGTWYNPDQLNASGLYRHQHMLRDIITDTYGMAISPTTSGTLIEETITYTIPEEINDIPVYLGDLEIVCFISDNQYEIESAHGSHPDLSNIPYAKDAGIIDLVLPETACSNVEAIASVSNFGSDIINSIEFEIVVNGQPPVTFLWNEGNLGSYQTQDIEIPATYFTGAGSNNYSIEVTAVNETPDENPNNNVADGTYQDTEEYVLPVTLHLETDANAWGTAWKLYDSQNNLIQQGDSYDDEATYDIELDVDAGCYKFVMLDSDASFDGFYSLKDGNNTTIIENEFFGTEEVSAFSIPIYEPTAAISSNTDIVCNGGTVQFYDASNGGASSWNWEFQGGFPAISNEKNPQITYSGPGSYDVTLMVSNALGTDVITMTDYITVSSLASGNLAVNLDGQNDYVECSDESSFDFTTALTLEVWMKPNSISGMQGILSKNYGDNAHPYQIRMENGELTFGIYSNSIGWNPVTTYNLGIEPNEWIHVAATYDQQFMRLYVNGVEMGSAAKNFEIPLNDQPFEIGRTNDVNYKYFDGEIDEVRVWNRALNIIEIADNMCTNYQNSTDPTLVAYYKFNECGGTLLTDPIGNHDGTLMNMNGDEWIESVACPTYKVKFIVKDQASGDALEGAMINLSGAIAGTDTDGEHEFSGFEPGDLEYSVSKQGYISETGTAQLVNEDLLIEISILYTSLGRIKEEDIKIYPNPSNGIFYLEVEQLISRGCEVIVSDLTGRKVYHKKYIGTETKVIDLANQKNGVYLLQLIFEDYILNTSVIKN